MDDAKRLTRFEEALERFSGEDVDFNGICRLAGLDPAKTERSLRRLTGYDADMIVKSFKFHIPITLL